MAKLKRKPFNEIPRGCLAVEASNLGRAKKSLPGLFSILKPLTNGRVAESNFCGTPISQTKREKGGGIASKSKQPKQKEV